MNQNPYSARVGFPSLKLGPKFQFASRMKRLGAKLIDYFFLALCVVIGIGVSYPLQLNILVFYMLSLGLCMTVQLFLLYKSAQTIGKKVLKIKIANEDGEEASFGQILGRSTVAVILGATSILGLIDVLLIFRESHQCAHDQVTKTLVIEA